MRRIFGMAVAVTIFVAVMVGWRGTPAEDSSALQGAWVVASTTDTAGVVNSEPQPGLYLFTATHYSMMFVPGAEPREQFPDSPVDAEVVAAYRSIVANSGRYELNGSDLTYRAYVAKNPNYMGGWPENANTVAIRIAGDTLHWTWGSGASVTMLKVEGRPAPW